MILGILCLWKKIRNFNYKFVFLMNKKKYYGKFNIYNLELFMLVGFWVILLMFFFLYFYFEFLFIIKVYDLEDEMYLVYRFIKLYLNLVYISLICWDILLRNLKFFGKM